MFTENMSTFGSRTKGWLGTNAFGWGWKGGGGGVRGARALNNVC